MTDVVFFYIYAMVALAGAIGLVTLKNLVHAAMCLFATLFAIAALFLLLGSEFLAAMQLFVYGGAITVLVLFVMMLTRAVPEEAGSQRKSVRWLSAAVCLAFFAVVAGTLGTTSWELAAEHAHDTASLAEILFSRYVLPFELAGLALTIALIGAVVLAREEPQEQTVLDTEPVLHATGIASEAAYAATAAEAGGDA